MTAMYKIIFATGNEGKMKEIREILDGLTFLGEKVQILSMKEAGIDIDIIAVSYTHLITTSMVSSTGF